ncbi:hypothetical protein [Candidatus Rhabdochlamydia porcellionis]|jgi:hypothetical protein|uniref:Uncharacterized protein n=1 Tax=Candidatus Rhabdochlamydia porcellionis TaxID=225148 RepID=A0ABX8Z2V8_9BACT|nr:hypothetical protein [Candidatus Rhabdochlamydia porcellionis]QZA58668.1 hypothetical protein RHAB15C_0000546 [Candidatus Rhabdochlamydia porcellionis]
MTIPNLNPSGLDLVAANQLVVESICSWRSKCNPQLELKVTSDG